MKLAARRVDMDGTDPVPDTFSRSTVQIPDISALADPAEEVLVAVQPTFVQLGAVPVTDDPVTEFAPGTDD